MATGHSHTVGAPARRPNNPATGTLPGPLIPVLVSLSLMVGAIALLYRDPTVAMVVMGVTALLLATGLLLGYIGIMLSDRSAS